jgi:DNA modification methylase
MEGYHKHNTISNAVYDGNFPVSVIEFKHDRKVGDKGIHPTQKPVDLLRYLVLTYTNPNDVVLDATIGSGTTAIACIKEHRHFVGFELNKEYFDRAVKRINDERRQLSLF